MDRLRYRLDVLMTARPLAKLWALFIVTMGMVAVGAAVWSLTVHPSDALWSSWTFIADPGTHVTVEGLIPRLVSVVITLGGFFSFALLVGLIAEGIGERVDQLKRGRSPVVESEHTLILGWSDKVLPLVRELAIANESEGGGVIVVLAEREKEEMQDAVADGLDGELRGSLVVCRTGSPLQVVDLEKVGARSARAIIVVARGDDEEEDDARAIRSVLALCRGMTGVKATVVVELMDPANRELVDLVSEGEVAVVCAHDMLGRLMIQCARQPGLAQVYNAMLGFEGDEFYLAPWPELTGMRFAEARRRFTTAVVCGVRPADGTVVLAPPDDMVLGEGDELLVLAEDNDTYAPGADNPAVPSAPGSWTPPRPRAEKVLFCGWRRNLHHMIAELESYVPAGSELTILAQVDERARARLAEEVGQAKNLDIKHVSGNPLSRKDLTARGIEDFDAVLILAGDDDGTPTDADARTLQTLLLVRDIRQKRSNTEVTLISEVCDPRTKRLIAVANVSDYVVSNELVSMALAAVSERKDMVDVWADLFSAAGHELYLRDPRYYVADGGMASFRGLEERARLRGEVALGYRTDGKLLLNPKDRDAARKWTARDVVVVLAEH
jgi:ion channel POLLUX/CASTOR